MNGTIVNIVNATVLITKDTERYKEPMYYMEISKGLRQKYYTAQIGDFIVFDEVEDEVTTSAEFQDLQNKYKNNGMIVRTVSPTIYGMSVDNVQFSNVG